MDGAVRVAPEDLFLSQVGRLGVEALAARRDREQRQVIEGDVRPAGGAGRRRGVWSTRRAQWHLRREVDGGPVRRPASAQRGQPGREGQFGAMHQVGGRDHEVAGAIRVGDDAEHPGPSDRGPDAAAVRAGPRLLRPVVPVDGQRRRGEQHARLRAVRADRADAGLPPVQGSVEAHRTVGREPRQHPRELRHGARWLTERPCGAVLPGSEHPLRTTGPGPHGDLPRRRLDPADVTVPFRGGARPAIGGDGQQPAIDGDGRIGVVGAVRDEHAPPAAIGGHVGDRCRPGPGGPGEHDPSVRGDGRVGVETADGHRPGREVAALGGRQVHPEQRHMREPRRGGREHEGAPIGLDDRLTDPEVEGRDDSRIAAVRAHRRDRLR